MFCVSVKVKLTVPLLVFVCILPEKAVPVTSTLSGGTLNPTHSLTLNWQCSDTDLRQDLSLLGFINGIVFIDMNEHDSWPCKSLQLCIDRMK